MHNYLYDEIMGVIFTIKHSKETNFRCIWLKSDCVWLCKVFIYFSNYSQFIGEGRRKCFKIFKSM